jgi:3-phenylpropionate/cinnamic acid dioxygenase small subunit
MPAVTEPAMPDAAMPDAAEAIRALVARYGELLDAGDLDGVAALFRDAEWRSGTRSLRGVDAIRAVYDDVVLYDGVPGTRHVMGDVVVRVDGDAATSRCSFTVFQTRPGFPLQAVLVGRYHDAFARVDGAWEFRERVLHADLIGDLSHHMRRPLG